MHYFLDQGFDPDAGILNRMESGHAIKSLRLRAGDTISIGNGLGTIHTCTITLLDKEGVKVNTVDSHTFMDSLKPLTIAMAPTKNPSRFEWFLEKATELGVSEIIPLNTSRTERPRLRQERLEKISLAASKQSQRPYLPKINELTDFQEVIELPYDHRYIAHCDVDRDREEARSIAKSSSKGSLIVLIGPEGDFAPAEIDKAQSAGFKSISLGQNRLRTETAGIFIATVFGI